MPARPSPPSAEHEIMSVRHFPASRERVFEAFREPDQLARWWGPDGFTSRFHEFDLRPGGRWRFEMVGPDGARYAQDKTFVEVAPPERVVLDHHQAGHDFRLTMTFEEAPGGTRVTWRMRFPSGAELAPVKDAIVRGNEENFDRLAAHLASAGATSGRGA